MAGSTYKIVELVGTSDASWEEAIGWRLVRDYELRMSKNEKDRRYWNAIEKLIPQSWDEESRKENFRLLHGLKRLAFPSIIELLQKGFPFYQHSLSADS